MKVYILIFIRFKQQTKWMGFIDVDEFLFIPVQYAASSTDFPSIPKLLEDYESYGGLMVDRFVGQHC